MIKLYMYVRNLETKKITPTFTWNSAVKIYGKDMG